MPGADGHCLDHCTSFNRFVLFCVDEIENVNQRRALKTVLFFICRLIVIPVVVIQVIQIAFFLVFFIRLVYYALGSVTPPDPPSSPLLFGLSFRLVLFVASIFMQKKYGPVLVTDMGLVRKHEFGKHMFIAGDGDWVLVFHDRPTINVEGCHQDVLDMILGAPAGVLGAQLPWPLHGGSIVWLGTC